jgi:nitroimidazol reductase NimA-like FMN-containing flavoprotein (pyridoxamine 5'-phosphate oxidase superfamily)
MEIDRNGLEVLDREECLRLIRTAALGRLAIHAGALPAIVPVNFALTDDGVVLRTGAGSKLQHATTNAVVAFEVDDHDPFDHTGWSVNVIGVAREVTDPGELAALARLPLAHWAGGVAEHYVRISLDVISGRRIVHTAAPAPVGV